MTTPEIILRTTRTNSILLRYKELGFKLSATLVDKLKRAESLNNLATPPTNAELAAVAAKDAPALLDRIVRAASVSSPGAQQQMQNARNVFDLDLYNALVEHTAVMYDAIAVKLHKELDKLTTDVCAVPHAFTMNPALWDRQERDSIDGLKRLRVAVPALTELVALLTELVEFLAPVRVGKQRELQAVKDLIPFYDFTGVQSPMLVEIARNLPNVPVVSVEMATYLKNFNVFFCVHPLDARHAVENELNGQALNWTEQDGRLIPANEARDLPGGVEFPVWSGTTIQ